MCTRIRRRLKATRKQVGLTGLAFGLPMKGHADSCRLTHAWNRLAPAPDGAAKRSSCRRVATSWANPKPHRTPGRERSPRVITPDWEWLLQPRSTPQKTPTDRPLRHGFVNP